MPSISKNHSASSQLERFDILDSLRFILALWVTVGHLGVFPLMGANPAPGLPHLIDRFLVSTVWGMPAVMAFFVISGFCIHYPLHNGRSFNARQFYLRRYTRILIPAAVIVAILYGTNDHIKWTGQGSVFFSGTLWSLLCEEIYYALYPALRYVRKRVGWAPILIATSIVSIALATHSTPARDWFDIGPLGTATILYPVWLLGCVLAEQATNSSRKTSIARIWLYRLAAWAAMWISEMLNFHSPVSQVHTMLFVGAIAFLWIREEISYGRITTPVPWMMKAGAWSYSLYLVHPLIIEYGLTHEAILSNNLRVRWVLELGIALAASYAFFLLIERPAHVLAKRVGKNQALTVRAPLM